MSTLLIFLISVVAFGHLYFMILEMFFWTKPKGLKAFGLEKEFAERSKVLASNQGLYNGFLAAGLLWGLYQSLVYQGDAGQDFKVFFLLCVVAAGVYGAMTVSLKILYIQSLPAAVELALLVLSLS